MLWQASALTPPSSQLVRGPSLVCVSEKEDTGLSKVPTSIMYNLSPSKREECTLCVRGEDGMGVCMCDWKWAQVSCPCIGCVTCSYAPSVYQAVF